MPVTQKWQIPECRVDDKDASTLLNLVARREEKVVAAFHYCTSKYKYSSESLFLSYLFSFFLNPEDANTFAILSLPSFNAKVKRKDELFVVPEFTEMGQTDLHVYLVVESDRYFCF